MREPVGDFYVHLVQSAPSSSPGAVVIDKDLKSSTALLSLPKKPTVIHFYDGG